MPAAAQASTGNRHCTMPDLSDLERLLHEAQVSRTRLRQHIIVLIYEELEFLMLLDAGGVSSMPYHKAAVLRNQVLKPLEADDYARAAEELDNFLGEWPMDRIMRLLVSEVQPALQLMVQREAEIAKLRQRI